MIVKVQLSLATSEPMRQVVVYNEDHSVKFMGDASSDVLVMMNDRIKAFFFAEYHDGGQLEFFDEAPWQEW